MSEAAAAPLESISYLEKLGLLLAGQSLEASARRSAVLAFVLPQEILPEAQLVGIGLAFQLLPPRRVLRSFRRRAEIFILKIHSYMNAVQPHGGMDHPALQTKTPKVKYVEKYTFAAREHTTRRLYYS